MHVVAPVHFLQNNFPIGISMKATLKMTWAIFNCNCLYPLNSINVLKNAHIMTNYL